ncbi:hypothetical protein C1646_670246 [Rhizophagus diaphanus]|nr:hypothetical protein C1646_670246 [Rhizophagus diaphanus] [Rhizophagus sp. MUCL 43196]
MEKFGKKIICERIIESKNYCGSERLTPLVALCWTCMGYKGSLKNAIIEAYDEFNDEYDADVREQINEKEEDEEEEKDKKEKEVEKVIEEMKKTVLPTSTDQFIDQNSNDEYLNSFQEP